VAMRSKARICGRSLAGIAGSNLAGVIDVFCKCYVLSSRGLCEWAAYSCRGVLLSVMCIACDRESSTVRRSWPTRGSRTMSKKWVTRLCMSNGTLIKQLINKYRPVK